MDVNERELMELVQEALGMNGLKLIDTGRGAVDARFIVGVLTLDPDDVFRVLPSGEKVPFPAYAVTQVMMQQGTFLTDEAASTIITRWRQALGGLPAPIGSEPS